MLHRVLPLLAHLAGSTATMQLHLLTDKTAQGAVCLDGSPAGVYFRAATDPAHTRDWVLFLQGGGWCYDEGNCLSRSQSTKGSSTAWNPTASVGGILDSNCSANPEFCGFNHAHIPYCDGNSFAGNREEPLVVNGTTLYLRGRQVLEGVLQTLRDVFGMSGAQRVMLSGCSAGGLATFMHADHIHAFLQSAAPQLSSFKAVPLSGFFLDHANLAGDLVYPQQMQYVHLMHNSTEGLPEACVAAHSEAEAWRCQMAQYIYPHVTAEMFIINSAVDAWQTGCILGVEVTGEEHNTTTHCNAFRNYSACLGDPAHSCTEGQVAVVNAYAADLVGVMSGIPKFSAAGSGAFIHSCHLHCGGTADWWGTVEVGGVSMRDAVAAWWGGSGAEPAASHTYLPCAYKGGGSMDRQCNPTCGVTAEAV